MVADSLPDLGIRRHRLRSGRSAILRAVLVLVLFSVAASLPTIFAFSFETSVVVLPVSFSFQASENTEEAANGQRLLFWILLTEVLVDFVEFAALVVLLSS